MLERLVIRDFALVETAEIAFGQGLQAVTGETGAGKSLLVGALAALVGQRIDSDMVREGARVASIEGEFHLSGDTEARVSKLLEDWGHASEGSTLLIRREISAEGRSRASVNQSTVTLASLKKLGELLLDLHGQHEHQSLLREGAALATLDRLAGLDRERTAYADTLAALREAEGEHQRLLDSLATYAERRDYLMTAARDLEEAGLREGEEESLAIEAARLAHADRLRLIVAQALDRLSEGEASAIDALGSAHHSIEQASALDPSLDSALAPLSEAAAAAQDAGRALAHYLDSLEADPGRLEEVESRRELMTRLSRRYRRSNAELLSWLDELRHELAQGEDSEGALASALAKRSAAEAACLASCHALTQRRKAAAKQWSATLSRELEPLGFPHATIAFEVAASPDARPGPTGLDDVELLFTPNPGEPGRPLARIASGGELSRVMLALKCALQTRDRVGVLVFDEVDSGIGGAVAQAVGERLLTLAGHRQVICITHLPMIAAMAGHHFSVSKQVAKGRTTARITELSPGERIEELARMLAGERVTDTTRRQARELLATPSGKEPR